MAGGTPKKQRKTRTTNLSQEEIKEALSPRQELFCILYSTDKWCFGNAAAAYADAYNLSPSQRKKSARQLGYQLLTNIYIKAHIHKMMQAGLKNAAVDNALAEVIHQKKDLRSRVAAIGEFNKLNARIKNKLDVTSNNKPLKSNIIVLANFQDEADSE